MTLPKELREEMIAWLSLVSLYSSEYWERQTDEFIELNYRKQTEDSQN